MKRKIFITGSGGAWRLFPDFFISLTGKENPKVCFLPTATGDSLETITRFYTHCEGLNIRPYVMKAFISSYDTKDSFEDKLLSMDAVIVGGGNTLNMMAIWKAQGIDAGLRKAYDAGILMAGGSAGSLCWFESGTTDSRPIELSTVECLGFIKGSHCPHYDGEEFRRPLYHSLIKSGALPAGYACDNFSGIYFENEKPVRCVSNSETSRSYFVESVNGEIRERILSSEVRT